MRVLEDISLSGLHVLDMGTGSGAAAIACARRGAIVTAVDIDSRSVEHVKNLASPEKVSIQMLQSDMFSNVIGKFDLILFNPPYLPDDLTVSDPTVDGGPGGSSIAERFLRLMPKHLKKGGYSLLLLSSINTPERLIEKFPSLSFKVVVEEKLFFETLTVFRVDPR